MASTKRLATALVSPGQTPRVYLDANVLLPQYLRSIFLDLADAGLIRVYWGSKVLEEVRRNLVAPAFGRTARQADTLLELITHAFPDALVSGSETLESQFANTTDPKDAHVAAGALKLSQTIYADQPVVLVTSNTKHLPQTAFVGTQVQSVRPGAFLTALLAARPEVATVLANMLSRFKAPPVSQEDFLAILDHSGCRAFATALAKRWGFIEV
ncbi:PIN domain-containing protein [Alcaligenes nematophilus]|uniref:PIN domain-containing protein n=1 Tax=Alcaligenes nematophilus TaxID=2994643 RepID=UPI0034E0C97A